MNSYLNKQTAVMAAMQLKYMCETQWGVDTFSKVSNDDALWAPAVSSSAPTSETATR